MNSISSWRRYGLVMMLLFFLLFCPSAFTIPLDEETSRVLKSAETLFQAMQDKNYCLIWQTLTHKTRQKIVDSVYKASTKKGLETVKDKILADFIEGGEIAKAYWNSYLHEFDPEIALRESKWTINKLEKDTAEINILYKKSPNPAVLQLYRENKAWKVGLEETFGARSLIPFK
ncbi:MAG: hypothetical protein JXA41_08160 [Deltaproteobacteria bacterium]|nr:hypothetical protein [Deltaproteobacteria bacterium]